MRHTHFKKTNHPLCSFKAGPKITKKDTGRGAECAEGVGCGEWCPPAHWGDKFLILYLKMATFSAFWALFCTVQLHVFQVKSSALGLKNCTHLQNFEMSLAICEKKLAIFASTGNYFRPCFKSSQ